MNSQPEKTPPWLCRVPTCADERHFRHSGYRQRRLTAFYGCEFIRPNLEIMNFFRFLALSSLCLGLASCAQSQPAQSRPTQSPIIATKTPGKLPLRVLIVSGGPTPEFNQYAIESNARYLEKLTSRATSQRVLFADGRKNSRTIAALQLSPTAREERVFAWLFDGDEPPERITYRASTLRRIDGPSTRKSTLESVEKLAQSAKPNEASLLYFTGHGSPGQKMRLSLRGLKSEEDFENTSLDAWDEAAISVKSLAKSLEKWPRNAPLVVVMVQCHAGGFANLLFEGGDPKNPVLNRNFCGFFAATGDRQASGCTSEVDETDYQDFTTHFFAALSGIARDGRSVTGADFDKNGVVSMLEALAWANLRDESIDVPLCTSDAYLRSIWPADIAPNWAKTPYATLWRSAAPWQHATLSGLSTRLRLQGDNRILDAVELRDSAAKDLESEDPSLPVSINENAVWTRFAALKSNLKKRFPGLKAAPKSARFQGVQGSALRYLATQKADVATLSRVMEEWSALSDNAAKREAQCVRFVRAARTIFLEQKLKTEGTATQKQVFARLRLAEGRNPLR